MVNIFTDIYYLTFVQELNKSLSSWQPTILPNSMCLQEVQSLHVPSSSLGSSSSLCSSNFSSFPWRIGSTILWSC